MDLLSNAAQAIQTGIEDYREGSDRRLKASVRNVHAGILLLYKEALRRISPDGSEDVLLKARIVPIKDDEGRVQFVGDGRKTADIQQIKERFEALSIRTDWEKLDRITKIRNEVEHYYTTISQKSLQTLIVDSFTIVRNFVADQLGEDPRVLLGEDLWQFLLQLQEVHVVERAACQEAIKTIEWRFDVLERGITEIACDKCGSDLLLPDKVGCSYREVRLDCRACGESYEMERFVPAAVSLALAGEAYVAAKHGGSTPYTD